MNMKDFIFSKTKVNSVIRILAILLVVFSVIITILYYQVEQAGTKKILKKADAAIVLGAAVWEDGKPSPSMKARVTEAVDLYNKGIVKKIIVSGGVGRFSPTEAEVMAKVAMSLGVIREDIILEKKATSTRENLKYSYSLGKEQGFKRYIIVSDAFHLKRASLMANDLGMKFQTAPALDSPLYTNKALKFKYTLRETLGLIKFYLVRILN
ncbi:Uncharacterized SAM-binding protein YcdF, DUF218 family [Desulfonispora thiosulfatigenes DSM 11270]|uniref:Uncharacterized SAM-binding protein YcdF, DUF218 family n=1 Tax=Desulfonispora thiosulfatigenes DSM 11270 TaxID=656914 RepID=A0A1W1VH46_DESTI|nr:YdcF family protein [Desulfonispora thiosulfatigenes]SMB92284.1 Uncharacterized SAM-binding protein YcdF, DUF218 family [Desulfonispora thiosulfatigenes DSM 11270]